MNIWLIGMMGSGKTTVGRLLASERAMEFRDVDSIISARVAGTISDLWQQTGEEGFRALEADVVEELATVAGTVIASGGGAVLAEANRQAMRRSGTVIWLHCSADTLAARLVGATDRPLLADDSTAPLAELLVERLEVYEDAAHHLVDTTSLTPVEVVEKIDEVL
jgi:shikimate kinase